MQAQPVTDSPLVCVIGRPVARSLSPVLHGAAFAAARLPWRYVTLSAGSAAEAIGLVRALGMRGANVTIPHKQTIATLCDSLVGDARATKAVNTIVADRTRLIGHNTDVDGFLRFLTRDARFDAGGCSALVLGGGGAARAVAVGLARHGARVSVAARRAAQAREVAALGRGIATASWGPGGSADLVVNATPAREGLPDVTGRVVVDLIYQGDDTPFLAAARASGARAFDGLGMLVHQAALAFELWTGRRAPLAAMRAAARGAAGRRPR